MILENPVSETQILVQDMQTYYAEFIANLPQIALGIILLFGFYFLSAPISKWLVKPLTYAHSSALIQLVIRRIISAIVILFGFYLFLRLVGLSAFAIALLSGTGVAGLIIGFAFKDIAENFMSSLLLNIQKPFKLGEVIEVSGHLGIVKQVTARATTLVDFDGNHIQIPNATVYKNTIRNLTANPNTRGKFIIGIGYDNDPSVAQDIGLQVLTKMDVILAEPEPQVLVQELGSSTYNLAVYFWANTHKHSLLKVRSLAIKNMMKAFSQANISMPDDAREIIFPEGITINRDADNRGASSAKSAPHNNSIKQQSDTNSRDSASHDEDLTSDNDDIRKQADQARAPEQGDNIL
ncbi:mechanosensitive ion channel family protein [Brumicola nitratireducens]|uniref:Small-conductance mechanosensitive channel n=1 Tax=Glaciecola nitratireducens (strain JCM 12485 / KCTC 12276 / FR1064) TaxID=1085623 RepID=G4QNQ2_GLANF|nr:mechanosensitive ion channel family protein [Glaciecola nitratireducens]AEP31610.1 MscS mechanosensitive ion channel [Glaciecola nitratireducens FR1064]